MAYNSRAARALAASAWVTACTAGADDVASSAATFADGTGGSGVSGSSGSSGGEEGDTASPDGSTSMSADGSSSEGSTGPTLGDPPDLMNGTWTFENISMTPGISLHGRRVPLDDGREIVAWAQSNPDDIGNVNIMSAEGPSPWVVSSVTGSPDIQNTYPALAGGGRALLAWAGQTPSSTDYDIFLIRSQGSAWTPPENISHPFEPAGEELADTEPVVLRRTDGGVAVVYLATLVSKFGAPEVPEVFVSKFFEDNEPSARIALHPAGAHCNGLSGATAPSGVFHVALSCVDDGTSTLIHATDRSGDWDTSDLNGVTSGVLSPSMTPGIEGAHLTWIQDVPCGEEDCSEVFHMATDSEEVFGSPVQVSDTANLDERMPTVGVDPWGRVLIFAQARVDNSARTYLWLSEDGETFVDLGRISPDGADDYQSPTSVSFDAAGNPSVLMQVVEDGSDPLNIDIHIARFEPA